MTETPLNGSASATVIARAVNRREISAQQVVEAAINRIDRANPKLNAVNLSLHQRALKEARQLDEKITAKQAATDPGAPLAGVPVMVKSLFDVAGHATLAGSTVLREQPPASQDATALAALGAAGALLLGATNMDEFAFGFTTENSHYGNTHNPHDLSRSAGGSSGGSAAAVAAGLVPIALGSDTNGSIRVPASFCGIYSLKPTYGRLSRQGMQLFSSSLDHVGIFARNPGDLAVAYNALQGEDPRDSKQIQRDVERLDPTAGIGPTPLRIARLGGYFEKWLTPEARQALEIASHALDCDQTVSADLATAARSAGAIITYAEAGNLHHDIIRQQRDQLDPLIRHRLVAGALTPADWYLKAQRLRQAWKNQLDAIFSQFDILLAAATPFCAPLLGVETIDIAGETLPMRPSCGLLTQPLTLAGMPIAVAPIKISGPLPMGVQIIAPPWREDLALKVARHLTNLGIAQAPVALIGA